MAATFADYLADRTTSLAIRARVLRQAPYLLSGSQPAYAGRRLPNADRKKPFSRETLLDRAPVPTIVLPRPEKSSLRSTE